MYLYWFDKEWTDSSTKIFEFVDYDATSITLPLYADKNHTCTFENWTETVPATCTTDGEEISTCICSRTSTRIVPAHHKFGEWTTTKAPTCTEKGEEKRTCTVLGCGAFETKTIDATGHIFDEWTTTKAPTCTENGEEKRTCTVLGCDAFETKTIKATQHIESTDYHFNEENHYTYCTICNEPITTSPHNYNSNGECLTCHKTFDVTFNETDDYYVVTGLKNLNENIVIPAMINNKPVKIIAKEAFKNANIKSLTIPESIKSIMNNAFVGCSHSLKIYYQGTIQQWCSIERYNEGSNPLAPDSKIINSSGSILYTKGISVPSDLSTELYINGDLLTQIIEDDNISNVGEYAFCGYKKLTSVFIKASTSSQNIERFAFAHCGIINLELNGYNENSYIGLGAFYSCSNIKGTLTINGFNEISSFAFYGCDDISELILINTKTVQEYGFYCDNLKTIHTGTLLSNIKYETNKGITPSFGTKVDNYYIESQEALNYVADYYYNSNTYYILNSLDITELENKLSSYTKTQNGNYIIFTKK